MDYRNEKKVEINVSDLFSLRSRLRTVMKSDPNAKNGSYLIRSLYFDTPDNKALREKLDGVNIREKFRLRIYNNDFSLIRLEKKSRLNGFGRKDVLGISKEEAETLFLRGEDGYIGRDCLLSELLIKMKSEGLRPMVIVEYKREPFIFSAGNVRVTLDYDIRIGMNPKDFFKPDATFIPARDAPILMEIKWDEFLPDIIRDVTGLSGRRPAAFSKYAKCRMYG